MAFTNFNDRDLNSFLLGRQQTPASLGPGSYQPSKDFLELRRRTKSKKLPPFNDGIAPGKETVAVGSNYLNQTYNPGPGKYNHEDPEDIIVKKEDESHYYVEKGGKLARRTQWFSADRTKKFATDDKSSSQFVHPSVGPGQYSPRAQFDQPVNSIKRFHDMSKSELKDMMQKLQAAIYNKKSDEPEKRLVMNNPPKAKPVIQKLTTVASIPHKAKGTPYVQQHRRQQQQQLEKETKENKYQARPPNLAPENPLVGPLSYEPQVEYTRPSKPQKGPDYLLKNTTERRLQWEDEIENKQYKTVKQPKFPSRATGQQISQT